MVPFPLVNLTVMAFSYAATSFLRDGLAFLPACSQLDKLTGKVFREDLVSGQSLLLHPGRQQAGRQGRGRLNTVIISELCRPNPALPCLFACSALLCPAYLLGRPEPANL